MARAIKTVFYALDVVNQGMQEKQSITVRCMDIEDLEKQAEAIRVEQIKLYESYADGVLLRDAYIEKKKALSEKLAALQDSIRTEKEEQECADELDEEIRALTKQASEKTYIGGLTKECVDAFVSMVYLYDDQTMKVTVYCFYFTGNHVLFLILPYGCSNTTVASSDNFGYRVLSSYFLRFCG